MTIPTSTIRNPALAPEGHLQIDWVRAHMSLLRTIEAEFRATQPLMGIRLGMSVHLTPHVANMAMVARAGGAEVHLCGSNPLSVQDDVAAALVENGVTVHAWYGETPEEYNNHLDRVARALPDIILDDGGDLTCLLHLQYPEQAHLGWSRGDHYRYPALEGDGGSGCSTDPYDRC